MSLPQGGVGSSDRSAKEGKRGRSRNPSRDPPLGKDGTAAPLGGETAVQNAPQAREPSVGGAAAKEKEGSRRASSSPQGKPPRSKTLSPAARRTTITAALAGAVETSLNIIGKKGKKVVKGREKKSISPRGRARKLAAEVFSASGSVSDSSPSDGEESKYHDSGSRDQPKFTRPRGPGGSNSSKIPPSADPPSLSTSDSDSDLSASDSSEADGSDDGRRRRPGRASAEKRKKKAKKKQQKKEQRQDRELIANLKLSKFRIASMLTYDNYNVWTKDVRAYAVAVDVLQVYTAAEMKVTDPLYVKPVISDRAEGLLYFIIRDSMSAEIRNRIDKGLAGKPEGLLRFLGELFYPTTVYTQHMLLDKLNNLQLTNYSYLPIMLEEVGDIAAKLTQQEWGVSDAHLVNYVTRALPDDYNFVVNQFLMSTQRPAAGSFQTLKTMLLAAIQHNPKLPAGIPPGNASQPVKPLALVDITQNLAKSNPKNQE
ncbi:MAG: hypothetical protein ACO3S0_12365 [bacterium]